VGDDEARSGTSCDRAIHRTRSGVGVGSCRVARAHCIDTSLTNQWVLHDGREGHRTEVGPGGHVPLARAGLLLTHRRLLDGTKIRNPHDGRMVDALALAADEGRGHAAKCPGEALAASDPGISEWGNPPGARPGTLGAIPKRAPGELKHLSTPRNREDSLSSGERTGRSPNPAGGIACRRCLRGVERVGWRGRQPPRRAARVEPKTAGTGHRRG
jgi:hypothetical protein